MKYTITTDIKALNKAIAAIKKASDKLDHDIQSAGLSCLAYAEAHGQVTPASQLYHAMPKGARRNALVEWLVAHGKLRVMTKQEQAEKIVEGKCTKEAPLIFAYDKERTTDMQGAEEKPWWTFRAEKAPQEVFDAQAAVHALLVRIQKMQQKGGIRIENREPAIAELKALAEALLPKA